MENYYENTNSSQSNNEANPKCKKKDIVIAVLIIIIIIILTIIIVVIFNQTHSSDGCSLPPTVSNATFSPLKNGYSTNDVITYQCDSNFVLKGNKMSSCMEDFSWSLVGANLPSCLQSNSVCNISSFPQHNGTRQVLSPPVAIGKVISYICDPGTSPRGSQTNQCDEKGNWINPPPSCESVCPTPPSIANGSIVLSSSSSAPYFAGEQISYQCDNGFTANDPANLINKCIVGNPNSWEKDMNTLFTVCRPNANIVLLLTKTVLGSCINGQPFTSAQRDFVNGTQNAHTINSSSNFSIEKQNCTSFNLYKRKEKNMHNNEFRNNVKSLSFQPAWGTTAITQGPSQIAVGFLQGVFLQSISGFSDDSATRTSRVNSATVPDCGSFSPGSLIGGAQSTYNATLNLSLPTYYLLLFDITISSWLGSNQDIAVSGLNLASTPIKNIVFPIAVTTGTSPDLVAFFKKYYTNSGSNLQSVTPGLYFDATTSGVTMTSIIDDIVTHCKTNNC